MPNFSVVAVGRQELAPLKISERLRSQLMYFMTAPGAAEIPALGEQEYWIAQSEVENWLEEGVFYLVSPLDTANATEVELSEEQETLLEWLRSHQVQHVRVEQ
jgi:hypothetical protein